MKIVLKHLASFLLLILFKAGCHEHWLLVEVKKIGTKKPLYIAVNSSSGALREIRTPDPLVRSQVLYPAEL